MATAPTVPTGCGKVFWRKTGKSPRRNRPIPPPRADGNSTSVLAKEYLPQDFNPPGRPHRGDRALPVDTPRPGPSPQVLVVKRHQTDKCFFGKGSPELAPTFLDPREFRSPPRTVNPPVYSVAEVSPLAARSPPAPPPPAVVSGRPRSLVRAEQYVPTRTPCLRVETGKFFFSPPPRSATPLAAFFSR